MQSVVGTQGRPVAVLLTLEEYERYLDLLDDEAGSQDADLAARLARRQASAACKAARFPRLQARFASGLSLRYDCVLAAPGVPVVTSVLPIRRCKVSITALEELMRKADVLTPDEQLRLASHLVELARRTAPPAATRRKWREIQGKAPQPLVGEDAQAWVTRARQAADGQRARFSEPGS